jgi:hypothetical protein
MEFACRGEAFADKNSHYSLILTANASPLRHIAIFVLVGKLLNSQVLSKKYSLLITFYAPSIQIGNFLAVLAYGFTSTHCFRDEDRQTCSGAYPHF